MNLNNDFLKLFVTNGVYTTMKITTNDILKMHSKATRETTHVVKPMITTDKKKKNNKYICRKKINKYETF